MKAAAPQHLQVLWYRIALLSVAILVVFPIWLVDYPGMVDYPNHLTRCYVLAHWDVNPVWQTKYIVVHDPIPNLAIDLIVTPLNHFLPILLSGKIFLSLTALLYMLGCSWLGRALLGKTNWLAPIAALTFYSSEALFGFVNYLFGVGVFLCAFAFWMQSRERMSKWRFLGCCLFSLAAYLSHLTSVVFLGIACVTVALWEWRVHRSFALLVRQLGWLITPLILMAAFMHGTGHVGVIKWPPLSQRAIHFFGAIRTYNLALDVCVFAVLLICAVIVLRRSRLSSIPVLLTGLILLFLFVITPSNLFTANAADARWVIPADLLILLSIAPTWNRATSVAVLVATLAMGVRTADIAATWITIDQREHRAVAMGDILPENARVYVFEPPLGTMDKLDRGFFHVIDMWTISKQVSVSTMFTIRGEQPLLSRDPGCAPWKSTGCLSNYDYIWTYNPSPAIESIARSVADPKETWGYVTIWQIRR